MDDESMGALHHVELWVPSLGRARDEWGWILTSLGYTIYQNWDRGTSWRRGVTYVVAEESPALTSEYHQRTAPGLNHLAFHAGSEQRVDALLEESQLHGWQPLFAEKHPYAGGPDNYAAYLVNSDGFEIELIASK
jgi:catechol 2,3-dioxygenase-like lactoylglutathione lyase family enzyme